MVVVDTDLPKKSNVLVGRQRLKYGFQKTQWELAKQEARAVLVECAKRRGTIPYSELVRKIGSIKFKARDKRLFDLLGEISLDEDAEGRGMLSVIVVHKNGDMQPGPGFFRFAKELGRDRMKCWSDELHKVHGVWSGRPQSSATLTKITGSH